MFLISKIVRGKRLLQELQAEAAKKEAEDAAAAATATSIRRKSGKSTSFQQGESAPSTSNAETLSRRRVERNSKLSQSCRNVRRYEPEMSSTSIKSEQNRKTVRQKTEPSSTDTTPIVAHDELIFSGLRRSSSMPSISDITDSIPKTNLISGPRLRHYDYDSKLNRLQKRSLKFTWHRLQTRNGGKRIEMVFEDVFERLLKNQSVIREMFTTRTFLSAMSRSDTATVHDHARETVRMIDHTIKNLEVSDKKRSDTGSDYDPILIGRAHGKLRPYGLTGNYWEKLGEVIIDVVLRQEAVRDLPGAGQAWVVLTACLVDQMRAGFEESKSGMLPIVGSILTHKVLYDAATELSTSKLFDCETDIQDNNCAKTLPCPSSSREPSAQHISLQHRTDDKSHDTPTTSVNIDSRTCETRIMRSMSRKQASRRNQAQKTRQQSVTCFSLLNENQETDYCDSSIP